MSSRGRLIQGELMKTGVGSGQIVLEGETNCRGPGGGAELVVDAAQMGLDGARAEVELCGDLRVGETLGHKAQDLRLPLGESRR